MDGRDEPGHDGFSVIASAAKRSRGAGLGRRRAGTLDRCVAARLARTEATGPWPCGRGRTVPAGSRG
ncbi:hypothetical protein SLNSH_17640 [Alsobacter soli]|uniref:Uncharacterized protein n=1 Tax=Alsobacter soli TaxID=2109933 RepID=A0A2T1HQ30_9HYPH|nr:hypothetical protein SLNSH_17640 [Alsobacter soli]